MSNNDNNNENKKVNNESLKELVSIAQDKDDKKKVKLSDLDNKEEAKSKKVVSIEGKKSQVDSKEKVKEEESDDEPKSKKVKLDDLIKKANEKDNEKNAKSDIVVNFNDEKNKAKKSASKNAKKEEHENIKDAKQIKKDIKELGSARKNPDEFEKEKEEKNKKQRQEENDIKEELNLDVLGVKRATDNSLLIAKIKETMLTVILIIIALLILMALPFFNVNDVNVTGLSLLDKEYILEEINYNKSKNFFHLLLVNPSKKLVELPQVNECEAKFKFPNGLDIRIKEINIAGYIPYLTEYIYIDSLGKVVESRNTKIEGIPLIEGLDFNSFKVGNLLETKNNNSLKTIIEITNVLNKYDISNKIDSIDVTSSDDLRLYINNIEVSLGEIEECDQKIRVAMEAISKLSSEAKGHLDVSQSGGKVYFRPLS